jgi:hypothetical protein
MRIVLFTAWLMLLVAALAWHYGPGQERLRLDDTARLLAQAKQFVADEQYAAAVQAYDDALQQLPAERTAEARRIRLERAKAQMLAHQLPEAHQDLKALVEELANRPGEDAGLVAEANATLANSRYYMTWLMRLEGLPREEWEPEVEAARQGYRVLAEESEAQGRAESSRKYREDLEATIRLARMDLNELQGLPLPSQ